MARLSILLIKRSVALLLMGCMAMQLAIICVGSTVIDVTENSHLNSIIALFQNDFNPDDTGNLLDPISDDSETEKESEEETSRDESKIYELNELSLENSYSYLNRIYTESKLIFNAHWDKIPTPPPERA